VKFPKIGIALLLAIVIGVAIFVRILIQQEERSNIKNLMNKGNHLVSLIALHSLKDFEGDKKNFFLRTLIRQSGSGLLFHK